MAKRVAAGAGGDADLVVDVLDVVVDGLRRRSRAARPICWLELPRATRRSTSTSRSLRPAGRCAAARGTRCPAAASTACDRLAVEPPGAHLAAQLLGGRSGASAGRCGRGSVIAW